MNKIPGKAESPAEIYHDEDYNPEVEVGFSLLITSHSVIWSRFLVKADIFEDDFAVSKSEIQLRLNTVNTKWTKDYHTYGYILISVGQWFLKTAVYWENNKVIGCHYCPRLNLTERGIDYDYRKVLQAVF